MKNIELLLVCVVLLFPLSRLRAQPANLNLWLLQLQSPDPSARQNGFYAIEKARIVGSNDQVKLAIITLLVTEEGYVRQQAVLDGDISEGYGTYFSDVVAAVAALHDVRSIDALSGVIATGNMVSETLAGFGASALPALLSASRSTDITTRFAVTVTTGKMLGATNLSKVSDAVSRAYIRLIVSSALVDSDPGIRNSAQSVQAVFSKIDVAGDVNDDGKIDCSDIAIFKTVVGKRKGQPGFEARADINLDGVIDIRDLAFVSQKLSAGTRCQ